METSNEMSNACGKDMKLVEVDNEEDLKTLKKAVKEAPPRRLSLWYHIGMKVVDNTNCSIFLSRRFSRIEEYTICARTRLPYIAVCENKANLKKTRNFFTTNKPTSKKMPKVIKTTSKNMPKVVDTKDNINWKFILIVASSVLGIVIFIILAYCCAPDSVKVSTKT